MASPLSDVKLLDPLNRLYRHELAEWVVSRIKSSRITPNEITIAHTLVGLSAAALIYHEHYVIAVLLYELRTVLDCVDGVLARAKNQSTTMGRALDAIGDGISFNSLMIAGALRLIQDFRNYNSFLIVIGVFTFALVAAHCGTVYQLMRRKLGSIIHSDVDSVELEWRDYYAETQRENPSSLSKFGFWLDSMTIRFVSKEWYKKVLRRKDSIDWREKAQSESVHMNELATITRKHEFNRAVKWTAYVSDDNILSVMCGVLLVLSLFPQDIFPNVHPLVVAFGVGFVYAMVALSIGLHYLHEFLHGVHRE